MPEPTPADGGAGDPTQGSKPTEPKKLDITQEELDRIIADRVARAKPKDYDELVQMRAEREAENESKKSELQREKDARKAAETAAADKTAKADAKLKKAAILAEAASQNAADADIVATLLMGSESITVEDDGEVKGAKEAVKALLKDKPILGKAAAARNGSEFGGTDPQDRNAKIAELEAKGDFRGARALKIAAQVATKG